MRCEQIPNYTVINFLKANAVFVVKHGLPQCVKYRWSGCELQLSSSMLHLAHCSFELKVSRLTASMSTASADSAA